MLITYPHPDLPPERGKEYRSSHSEVIAPQSPREKDITAPSSALRFRQGCVQVTLHTSLGAGYLRHAEREEGTTSAFFLVAGLRGAAAGDKFVQAASRRARGGPEVVVKEHL